MKKIKSVLLLGILLLGCSEYDLEQNKISDTVPKTKVFESSETDNYLNSCENTFKILSMMQEKISAENLTQLVDLYNLYKSSPETYQLLLEEKVKEMYSEHDIALLEESYNDLIKHKRIITANRSLHRITEDEKENLLNEVIFRIPSINEKYLKVFRLTRAGDNETACLRQCEDNYRWELIGIASEAVCVAGIAFISACVSLGSLTIPAIIALIVEYAKMDYALATAERTYNQCCAAC